MNFLKTQASSSALCHKPAANTLYPFLLILSFVFLFNSVAIAKNKAKSVDAILKQKTNPAGVVIEIVTGGDDSLEWALPLAQDYIKKLRNKYPELAIAIVSHGAEQFALTNDEKDDNREIHQLVQSIGKADIPVHVCETYAGWQGLSANDFPAYVNVSAAGPAQVNDYLSMDYELIIISGDDE